VTADAVQDRRERALKQQRVRRDRQPAGQLQRRAVGAEARAGADLREARRGAQRVIAADAHATLIDARARLRVVAGDENAVADQQRAGAEGGVASRSPGSVADIHAAAEAVVSAEDARAAAERRADREQAARAADVA